MPVQQAAISENHATRSSAEGRCILQAGVKLQLQFLDQPERGRYQVTVIGHVERKSLLITAPQANGHVLLLREGQQFVVRLLSGKQIIGFNSEVLKVYNNPFPYVHLKSPREVEQQNVRNAYRVELNIIATVQCIEVQGGADNATAPAIAAKVTDMSTTGCQLKLPKALPQTASLLSFSTKVEVAGQKRLLSLEARIRSHRETEENGKNWHIYGVQFEEMCDDRRLLLNCFVYEQLVREIFRD